MSHRTVDHQKGIFPHTILFVIFCLFNALVAEAQMLLMGSVGRHIMAGNEQFYDSGGAELDYVGKAKEKAVLCAPQDKSARIKFAEFELETAFDILYAYRGSSESGQFIREYTGTQNPGEFIVSAGECICFVFTSDDAIQGKGWRAEIELLSAKEVTKVEDLREVKLPVIAKEADNGVYRSTPTGGKGDNNRNSDIKPEKKSTSEAELQRTISASEFEKLPENRKRRILESQGSVKIID